jgi:hypothetical protein
MLLWHKLIRDSPTPHAQRVTVTNCRRKALRTIESPVTPLRSRLEAVRLIRKVDTKVRQLGWTSRAAIPLHLCKVL